MLYRFRKEIVADLPTVYEMPDEAVKWVDRMIDYTVAGGKMNRGLALMAVQQTLAQSQGRTLSNKVNLHLVTRHYVFDVTIMNFHSGATSIRGVGLVR